MPEVVPEVLVLPGEDPAEDIAADWREQGVVERVGGSEKLDQALD